MITSLERKLAKYQRNLSTQRRGKGRQRIAVKEMQKKAISDVMSRSSSSTSSSDSFDWKKSAQVHCCRKIEALVFLLANSMIVRQGMFFNYEKRRHARKCVIWPILGTSFSTNRHIHIQYIYIYIYEKSMWLLKSSQLWEGVQWNWPTYSWCIGWFLPLRSYGKSPLNSMKIIMFKFNHCEISGV